MSSVLSRAKNPAGWIERCSKQSSTHDSILQRPTVTGQKMVDDQIRDHEKTMATNRRHLVATAWQRLSSRTCARSFPVAPPTRCNLLQIGSMTAVIALVLAVAILLVVVALARLTRLMVSIKARLDALEHSSRTTSKAGGDPRVAAKTRSMFSSH
jgi:hypothetical protein